ncbi:hypothetical protein ACQ26G_004366 [Yersinia enterocolitica]
MNSMITTLEAGADALPGKNNTWTATNKFIGGLSVAAPAGSSEGGQIDLDDKDSIGKPWRLAHQTLTSSTP